MEKPIPLTDPQGIPRAYMCSGCSTVSTDKRLVEKCCTCPDCGVRTDRIRRRCDSCEKAKSRIDQKLQEQARLKAKLLEDICASTLKKAKDKNAAALLRTVMENLSERFFMARWQMYFEHELWAVLHGQPTEDIPSLSEYDSGRLLELHRACGGWWSYLDYNGFDALVFLPTDEWLKIHKKNWIDRQNNDQ